MARYMQYIAMITGSIWVSITGVNIGWSSPYLPILQTDDSPVGRISSEEAFWCSVMPLVGAIPGALLSGILVDKVGRRNMLVAITPVCFTGFITIAFTTNIWILDIARFLLGATEGITFTVLPMYFGEIAEPKIRGVMSSSILVGSVLGLLIINVLARFMTIFTSALVTSAIPILHFFLFLWLPKSPYFLIKIGHMEEAKKNLLRLRNEDEVMVNEEFLQIGVAVKRQEAAVSNVSWTDLFTEKGNRRAVYIYLILITSNKFSGVNPLTFYTDTIFAEAGGILDAGTSTILYNLIGFLSVLFAAFMTDKFGRRPLLIISAIGCGCSLALMATYLTLQRLDFDIVNYFKWLPLVAMFSYFAIFNMGLCLGPVVYLSELFPTSVKGYALGIADSTSVIFATIASKLFHAMTEMLGMHSAFWCFSTMCILGTIMIYTAVPETKGKTLEQIQLELNQSTRSQSSHLKSQDDPQ